MKRKGLSWASKAQAAQRMDQCIGITLAISFLSIQTVIFHSSLSN